jgi:hypothetical protein
MQEQAWALVDDLQAARVAHAGARRRKKHSERQLRDSGRVTTGVARDAPSADPPQPGQASSEQSSVAPPTSPGRISPVDCPPALHLGQASAVLKLEVDTKRGAIEAYQAVQAAGFFTGSSPAARVVWCIGGLAAVSWFCDRLRRRQITFAPDNLVPSLDAAGALPFGLICLWRGGCMTRAANTPWCERLLAGIGLSDFEPHDAHEGDRLVGEVAENASKRSVRRVYRWQRRELPTLPAIFAMAALLFFANCVGHMLNVAGVYGADFQPKIGVYRWSVDMRAVTVFQAIANLLAAVVTSCTASFLHKHKRKRAQKMFQLLTVMVALYVLLFFGVIRKGFEFVAFPAGLAMAALAWYLRHRVRRRTAMAFERVKGDMAIYDRLWEVERTKLQAAGVSPMHAQVQQGQHVAGHGPLEHLCELVGSLKRARAAASLGHHEQQLVQPDVPPVLLIALAWQVNGLFQSICADFARVPTPHGMHSYCEPKRPQRAIQKLWRSYKGNHRRWCDLVRSSIVLTDMQCLCDCLGAILDDKRVTVCKIKNRFDPAYDARGSAGYRDVSLLLKVDPHACSLPAESPLLCVAELTQYVCELQLQFEPFYKVKTGEGHARYVELRNALAL